MAIVGLAGPLTNFVIAIVVALILNWIAPSTTSRAFQVMFLLFQINVVLGIFNLIPIPPLDGSRVLGAFLPRGAYEKWVAVDRYGMLLVIVVIIAFQSSFFRLLEGAMLGLAHLLLTNYTFL
jgi:Zn-dependent protease